MTFLQEQTNPYAFVDRTISVDTGFGENIDELFNAQRRASSFVSLDILLFEEYQREVETVAQDGKDIVSPHERPRLLKPQPGDRPVPITLQKIRSTDELIDEFHAEAAALGIRVRSKSAIRQAALRAMFDAEMKGMDVADRATFLGSVGGFLGMAGAAVIDTPVLLSVFATAPFSAGLLAAIGLETAVALGVEAGIQTRVQPIRTEAGLEGSFAQGAANVALAGLGTAALGGALGGLVIGSQKLINIARARSRKSQIQLAAEDSLDRLKALQDANPPNVSEAEHARRIDVTETQVRAGERAPAEEFAARAADPEPEVAAAPPRAAIDTPATRLLAGLDDAQREALADLTSASLTPDQFLDLITAARAKPKAPRFESLVDFLTKRGGVRDSGGELANIGLKPGKGRPGFIRKAGGEKGLNLEDAAQAAGEAGFLGGRVRGLGAQAGGAAGRRGSVDELVAALQRETAGERVLTDADAAALSDFDLEQAGIEDFNAKLLDSGLDIDKLTDGEILAVLDAARQPAATLAPPGRAGLDQRAEVQERLVDEELELDEIEDVVIQREIQAQLEEDGDLDFNFLIDENDDGQIVKRTYAQVLRDNEADASVIEEFANCVTSFDVPF